MVKEIAEYFSLTIWDWFTAVIAVTSLIVAICAFIVAMKTYSVSKRTLASQIQTELNTTPPINVFIQRFLLKKFMSSLFLTHIEMRAIWHVIKENNYMYYLPISITDNLLLSKKSIHRELFYEDETAFGKFNELYNEIDKYNSNIKAIKEFTNIKTNNSFLDAIFELEEHITTRIVYLYIMIMNDEFHCSTDEIGSPIDDVCRLRDVMILYSPKFGVAHNNDETHNDDETSNDGAAHNYFNTKDVFSLLKTGDLPKEAIISFMNKNVKNSMDIYSKYLIKF